MKAYICDQCEKRDDSSREYDLPPKGWFSVNEPNTFKLKHLCGPACLAGYAQDKVTVPIEQPAEAPRG